MDRMNRLTKRFSQNSISPLSTPYPKFRLNKVKLFLSEGFVCYDSSLNLFGHLVLQIMAFRTSAQSLGQLPISMKRIEQCVFEKHSVTPKRCHCILSIVKKLPRHGILHDHFCGEASPKFIGPSPNITPNGEISVLSVDRLSFPF